jgi:SAM-dependent methyltransferase
MNSDNVRDFYNRQYRSHQERHIACPQALHDLGKANRRVAGVLRAFGIHGITNGSEVLDVGSGLGYYTKALASTGASVTGIDFSDVAIDAASTTFPECQFVQGAWPDDIPRQPRFDLIWMVNFSLMNTFDVEAINDRLIVPARERLKPGGHLVVGWNSDFSGSVVEGYSHWSRATLADLQKRCGLSAPLVTEARTLWLSSFLIRAAYLKRRSIPIFMILKKAA